MADYPVSRLLHRLSSFFFSSVIDHASLLFDSIFIRGVKQDHQETGDALSISEKAEGVDNVVNV